jgi:D-alanyl-D-alanine carboxypeptidase
MSQIPDPADLDEALRRALSDTRAPGAQAALVRRGEVVWTGSAGVAETDARTPVTDETVFCLASLGKTIVATLALRLVEEQRLDLDAPIEVVLGDDLPGAAVVTPRMLLTHTSGFPDLYESPEVRSLMPAEDGVGGEDYDPDRPFTWEMLVRGIRTPMEPGAHWAYSNTGYLVLTHLLCRVLGGDEAITTAWRTLAGRSGGPEPLSDGLLTPERSAVPLDRLAHGHVDHDGTMVNPYAAYRPSGVPCDLFGLPFGDGLFAGTALGYALFLDALFVRRTLLEPATVDLMTVGTSQAAAADVPQPFLRTYGAGTFRRETAGRSWQGHSGGYGGFSTLAGSDTSSGDTLVVLTNAWTETPPASPIWDRLVDRLVTAGDAGG